MRPANCEREAGHSESTHSCSTARGQSSLYEIYNGEEMISPAATEAEPRLCRAFVSRGIFESHDLSVESS